MMLALATDNRISAPSVDAALGVAWIPLAGPGVGLVLAGLAMQSGHFNGSPKPKLGRSSR